MFAWARMRGQLVDELQDADASKPILDQLNLDTRPITVSEITVLENKMDEFDDDVRLSVLRKFKRELARERLRINALNIHRSETSKDENYDLQDVIDMRDRLKDAKWIKEVEKSAELRMLELTVTTWQKQSKKKHSRKNNMFHVSSAAHMKHAEKVARMFELNYQTRVSRVLAEMRKFNDAYSLAEARDFVSSFIPVADKKTSTKKTSKKSASKQTKKPTKKTSKKVTLESSSDYKHSESAERLARRFDLSYQTRVSRVLSEMRKIDETYTLSEARNLVSEAAARKKT